MANALDSECGCSSEMPDARFNPGDVVLHKVLGQGTVREVSDDGDYLFRVKVTDCLQVLTQRLRHLTGVHD